MWSRWPAADTIADGVAVQDARRSRCSLTCSRTWTTSSPSRTTSWWTPSWTWWRSTRWSWRTPGCCTVAALKHLDCKGKNVVSILSGGNMDVITMSSLVQHGLISRGRVFTFSVQLPDRPGELRAGGGDHGRAERQHHQAGAQPVREHQPPGRGGAWRDQSRPTARATRPRSWAPRTPRASSRRWCRPGCQGFLQGASRTWRSVCRPPLLVPRARRPPLHPAARLRNTTVCPQGNPFETVPPLTYNPLSRMR